jgi:hypothetical protein
MILPIDRGNEVLLMVVNMNAVSLAYAGTLFGSLFKLEDGDSIFLQNIRLCLSHLVLQIVTQLCRI